MLFDFPPSNISTPPPGVRIESEGDTEASGLYELNDILVGKPHYTKSGEGGSTDDQNSIKWNGSNWEIWDSSATRIYISANGHDEPKPWQVQSWVGTPEIVVMPWIPDPV